MCSLPMLHERRQPSTAQPSTEHAKWSGRARLLDCERLAHIKVLELRRIALALTLLWKGPAERRAVWEDLRSMPEVLSSVSAEPRAKQVEAVAQVLRSVYCCLRRWVVQVCRSTRWGAPKRTERVRHSATRPKQEHSRMCTQS